ncbi:MAG: DUF4412 domain-containing protein [Methanococcaceae archaeon]
MRNKLNLLFTAFFFFIPLLLTNSYCQKSFEGVVDVKISGTKEDNKVKLYVKNDMARVEMNENAKDESSHPKTGSMIFKDKKMIVLMPEKKQYFERKFDLSEKKDKYDKKVNLDKNLQKTGKTQTILGHTAEQWLGHDDNGENEIWMTNELGSLPLLKTFGATENDQEWQKKLAEGYFPLLGIQRTVAGKEKGRFEVTNIEQKSLSNDIFSPPGDFKKMEMPERNKKK